MVSKLPREVSDHNPLIVTSGNPRNLPCTQFKFDLNWFNNPDFFMLVEKIWSKPCKAKSTLDKIKQKLKLFKQFFKGWGFNLQGELRKKRKDHRMELSSIEAMEESFNLSSEQILRKHWVICENLKLLEQEEMYWFQRSHEI